MIFPCRQKHTDNSILYPPLSQRGIAVIGLSVRRPPYKMMRTPFPAPSSIKGPRMKMKWLLACLAGCLCAGASQAAPLQLAKGARVSLVGNTLAERMQHHGWLE